MGLDVGLPIDSDGVAEVHVAGVDRAVELWNSEFNESQDGLRVAAARSARSCHFHLPPGGPIFSFSTGRTDGLNVDGGTATYTLTITCQPLSRTGQMERAHLVHVLKVSIPCPCVPSQ